ncbi:hypothetical protein ABIF15_001636 [Bradyrhizobium elkanii]
MIGRRVDRQPRRPWIEMQRGDPRLLVEAAIFQHHVGRAEQFARADATPRPALAAHLEQIGKVVVEQQREIEARGMIAVILQADALIGRAAPQEDRAHDVQRVLRQGQTVVAIDVGIGEVDRQRRIVVAHVGAEQERLHVLQHHFQPRQVAGVGVEQAVRPAGRGADVAMAVEHDEGVVMLERAPRPRRGPGHRNVERRFGDVLSGASGDDLRNDVSCHLNLWRLCLAPLRLERTHRNARTRLRTRGQAALVERRPISRATRSR